METISNQASKVKVFNDNQGEFSFPYKIQVSKRAKRLNLKVSAEQGVQLITPPFTSKIEAMTFLKKNVAWIEKNQYLWQQYQATITLPDKLDFPALQRCWAIEYVSNAMNKRPLILEGPEDTLVYFGKDDDTLKIKKLRQWCQHKAQQFLQQRMVELSTTYKFSFNKLSFRHQRTLWGSCNQAKHINLNYKLIFLPAHLIDYILIHELVHTLHLNHSHNFWALVAKCIPDYKKCCKELRTTTKLIPNWF